MDFSNISNYDRPQEKTKGWISDNSINKYRKCLQQCSISLPDMNPEKKKNRRNTCQYNKSYITETYSLLILST